MLVGTPGYADIHSAFVSCADSLQTARLLFALIVLCPPAAVGWRELVHGSRLDNSSTPFIYNSVGKVLLALLSW